MKLSEIITLVQGLLSDDQFDPALITAAANWFQWQIFNDVHTRLMESSSNVEATTGDSTAPYPSNLQTLIGVYVTSPRVFQLSDPMEYKSFMNSYANFATATAREVSVWTPYGNAMRFSAPVSADTTFQIDYLREPKEMTQPSSKCEIPNRYQEMIVKGTLVRCMEINEDYAEADTERDLLEPLILAFRRNEGRGGGKTGAASIMRTNRGRGRSHNPFEDGLRG